MPVSVLGRLGAVTKVLAAHRDEPAVRGRAARIAGAALIADGLVGLENPLGKQSRSGIVGGAVILAAGILLLAPAARLGSGLGPYPDGIIVAGEVASVALPSGDGSSCSMTFRYELAGATYERSPGWSGSGFCDLVIGDAVEVSVLPDDPGRGRLASNGSRAVAVWLPRLPWVLVVAGAWTVLVRAISIVAGVWLYLWGRRATRGAPVGSEDTILAELRGAWSGTV